MSKLRRFTKRVFMFVIFLIMLLSFNASHGSSIDSPKSLRDDSPQSPPQIVTTQPNSPRIDEAFDALRAHQALRLSYNTFPFDNEEHRSHHSPSMTPAINPVHETFLKCLCVCGCIAGMATGVTFLVKEF